MGSRGRKDGTFGRRQVAEALQTTIPSLGYKDALGIVDWVYGAIIAALKTGARVVISGFGTFTVHRRPAALCRDPRTGNRVKVPERRVVRFVAGRTMRREVCGR
jgi:integration host factor subunit beta